MYPKYRLKAISMDYLLRVWFILKPTREKKVFKGNFCKRKRIDWKAKSIFISLSSKHCHNYCLREWEDHFWKQIITVSRNYWKFIERIHWLTCATVVMIVDGTRRVTVGISANGQISVAMRQHTFLGRGWLIEDAPVGGRSIQVWAVRAANPGRLMGTDILRS